MNIVDWIIRMLWCIPYTLCVQIQRQIQPCVNNMGDMIFSCLHKSPWKKHTCIHANCVFFKTFTPTWKYLYTRIYLWYFATLIPNTNSANTKTNRTGVNNPGDLMFSCLLCSVWGLWCSWLCAKRTEKDLRTPPPFVTIDDASLWCKCTYNCKTFS